MAFEFLSNPVIFVIKIFALIFNAFIYVFGGILISLPFDKYIFYYFYDATEEEAAEKSTIRHVFEAAIILSMFCVITYIGRNILQEIPFILDGFRGFDRSRIKEMYSGGILFLMMMNFSPVIRNKIPTIRERFKLLLNLKH